MNENTVRWEAPFCGEGNSCFRFGTDAQNDSYIAVAGAEDSPLVGNGDALRTLIRGIKNGKTDHLL